jgi:hypothetical protein
MTHHLPPHPELPSPTDQQYPPSYVTELGPGDQHPPADQPPHTPAPPTTTSGRKRKKQDGNKDDTPRTPAEPRRLRRSHEVSVDRGFPVRGLPNFYASPSTPSSTEH